MFLPPKLPHSSDGGSHLFLVHATLQGLYKYQSVKDNEVSVVQRAISAIESIAVIHAHQGDLINEPAALRLLRNVRVGNTVAFHIQAQNAAIMFTRSKEGLLADIFEISARNADVTGTAGRLVRDFPGRSVMIPMDTLQDADFLPVLVKTLATMAAEPVSEMLPQSKKSGISHSETRDSAKPLVISELLFAFLCSAGSHVESTGIRKSTRDEINWDNTLEPWRRSPMWLVIRVVLQLVLERGPSGSRFRYKEVMLFILSHILKSALVKSLHVDGIYCMTAKLDQRLTKLLRSCDNFDAVKNDTVIQEVMSTMQRANKYLEGKWQEAQTADSDQLDFSHFANLDPTADSQVAIPELDQYILRIHSRERNTEYIQFQPSKQLAIFEAMQLPVLPDSNPVDSSYASANLRAFESWVDEYLTTWAASVPALEVCKNVHKLMKQYHDLASKHYEANPEAMSIMLLTTFEMWVASDRAITEYGPFRILAEYDPGVETRVLQNLLLSSAEQMRRLAKVESYLSDRKSRSRLSTGQIFTLKSSDGLPSRYTRTSQEHIALLRNIRQRGEADRAAKLAELQRLRQQYKSLDDLYKQTPCQMDERVVDEWNGRQETETFHSPYCRRCRYRNQRDQLRIHVFEHPLPASQIEAESIIFELDVPPVFAHWRDLRSFFLQNVLGGRLPSVHNQHKYFISGNDPHLSSRYFKHREAQRIDLLSTIKPAAVTHYKSKDIPSSNEHNICVPNALRYQYYDTRTYAYVNDPTFDDEMAIKCTFKTFRPSLQQFLLRTVEDPDGQPPNEVIASQESCPVDMSLDEYKALLSIPLGRYVQWLNMERELAMPTVDFRKADTARIFLQCIHQTGPASSDYLRQSHKSLLEGGAAKALISHLHEALQRIRRNWGLVHALAVFVAIACRVSTLVTSANSEAMAFLAEARGVATEWTRILVEKSHKASDDADRLKFVAKSLESALICLATYDVDDDDLRVILTSTSQTALLIEMSVAVEEYRMAKSSEDSLISMYRCRCERLLHRSYEMLSSNPRGLSEGIRRVWAGFPNACTGWSRLKDGCGEWVTTEVAASKARVHYNLITGQLLVNGQPLNEPPRQYQDQQLFKDLFGIHRVEVLPVSQHGFRYSTKRRFGGFEILLGLDSSNNLLVRAIGDDGVRWEVVPKLIFDRVYPEHFTQDYIHWCNLATGEIRLASKASHWPSQTDRLWGLIRSKVTKKWTMQRGNERLINLSAFTALSISKILAPLSTKSRIHTIFNDRTRVLDIELPLSNLKFYIQPQSTRLYSKDYPNMHVAREQYLGSLVGLRNKLILQSDVGNDVVLVPEASLSYTKSAEHISIVVDVTDSTRVHALEVDGVLHRLISKNELGCQLYLAYLHALTSFCLPDPFLKCSGTERALEILKSKSILSHSAFSAQNVAILRKIADLSPERQFYPTHLESMQLTKWDRRLSCLTQDDEFVTVAESIIRHFERQKSLRMWQLEFDASQIGRSSTQKLRSRASNRNSYLRVAGYGADCFTTSFDRQYEARDTGWTIRATNSHQMAVLLSRTGASPHWPTGSEGDLLKAFLRSAPTVRGAVKAADPGIFQYGASCLTPEAFCGILTDFPALQSWLADPNKVSQRKFAIRIWLASLAFAPDADLTTLQVLALVTKGVFQDASPDTPKQSTYFLGSGMECKRYQLAAIIERQRRSFEGSSEFRLQRGQTESKKQYDNRRRSAWQAACSASSDSFLTSLVSQWPTRAPTIPSISSTYFNFSNSMTEVRKHFEEWFDNVNFSKYLRSIEKRVHGRQRKMIEKIELLMTTPSIMPRFRNTRLRGFVSVVDIFSEEPPKLPNAPQVLDEATLCSQSKSTRPYRLESVISNLRGQETSEYERAWISDLEQSLEALKSQEGVWDLNKELVEEAIDRHLLQQTKYVREIEQLLRNALTVNNPIHNDGSTCRWPRLRPILFLQQLTAHYWTRLPRAWKQTLIEYALGLSNLQRAQRLKRFAHSPEDLVIEVQNVGHEAWNPLHYPEWLILEVENGLTIRSVQREIAGQMISPNSAQNSVMQLNMGEGKSTVIVPMIVIALADGSKLTRVIVNRPQSKQMLQMLISKFGGIIDRQIYQLPFARSPRLDETTSATVKAIIHECMGGGGILLMQPEHILSFQHMAPEYYIMENPVLGRNLLDIQKFLDNNTRDVIDESDENFSVKLELIYTMGQQQSIEASPDRWHIPQHVLGVVRKIASSIADSMPEDFEYIPGQPGSFPRLRFLTTRASSMLLEKVANHISTNGVPGLQLSKQPDCIRMDFERYICKPDITEEDASKFESSSIWTETTKSLIMLLRGLFAKGLLTFVFGQKRWRVNYGLAVRDPATQLAVPYRAKDCPALRSEFSHPDVVIVLTCLCYYYKGLSDADLFTALAHLMDSDQADINYRSWIDDAPNVDLAFRQLQGVNLQDRPQCIDKLFPSIRFSKAAIDYFLSEIVFPKEIKEFPSKLSASGWDIGKTKNHVTTGFSGTNDSCPTLPLDVAFLDLPKQKHTNALVLERILQPENSVKALNPPQSGFTDAESILQQILNLNLPVQVILDAGAQVLEDNLAFAKAWLKEDRDKEAVVFVDESDNVSVVDRMGRVELLHASPFASSLSSCLVFLDQSHTRGIDLKLPRSYRAAVTLGPRLTKDNLVQACMRMRKLGQGQSVVFCIPRDVLSKIDEHISAQSQITTADVINWAISETFTENRRSMPLWKLQGERYIRQRFTWDEGLGETNAHHLLEKESQEIDIRYRPHVVDHTALQATQDIAGHPDSAEITNRCREFGQINLDLSALQEEQERELAPEIEQECERQRAPPRKAARHELHREVVAFAKTGRTAPGASAYIDAFLSLSDTTAAKHFPLAQLGMVPLKATKDFMRTVEVPESKNFVSDLFLRSVHWLLVATNTDRGEVSAIMIISPYEANKLLPSMKGYATSMHVYAPRCNQGYRPMDSFDFHEVPPTAARVKIPLQLVATLNAFAGQLYFSTFEHYRAFGEVFGLTTECSDESTDKAGYRLDAQGFILSDEQGRRGGASGLTESPVRLLRDFTLIRNGGRAFTRTQVGDVLDGKTLSGEDFTGQVEGIKP